MRGILAAFALVAFVGQNVTDQKDTSPHTEQFVEANGFKLHYLDWGGEGEPLVLLTGYGPSAHTFDELAPRFADRFRVLAVTRRGTAPSERTSSGYDLETLTSDLEAFLDVLELRRVHLVGHSFGGTEMTQFATLHPERVISLVYLDAALDLAAGQTVIKESPVPNPQPAPGSPYSQVLEWTTSYSPNFSKLKAPALAFYAMQENPAIPANATEDLRRRSEEYWRTKWIPMVQRIVEKFRRETPNGRVVIMEDASHYMFRDREDRDEIVQEMEKFYASIER